MLNDCSSSKKDANNNDDDDDDDKRDGQKTLLSHAHYCMKVPSVMRFLYWEKTCHEWRNS